MTVYDELEAACLPLIEAYQDDLLKHDRASIEANPGKPFLHWTRSTGTEIAFLLEKDDLPARGVVVPYLFGTADRRHMARHSLAHAEFHAKESNSPERYTVHYYTGKTLRQITAVEAVKIAREHHWKIIRQFDEEENGVRKQEREWYCA